MVGKQSFHHHSAARLVVHTRTPDVLALHWCVVRPPPQDTTDLPTDVDFKWAQDSYNATQRNLDTWLFFGTFRTRLWLLDQKWSYPGGFTGGSRGEGGTHLCCCNRFYVIPTLCLSCWSLIHLTCIT